MEEEEDDIKKIQKSIDEILGIESGLAHINGRSLSLKHDYKIDFIEYDDVFFNVIEALITLHFNKDQKSLIEWYYMINFSLQVKC